jgi:hypothetical protein
MGTVRAVSCVHLQQIFQARLHVETEMNNARELAELINRIPRGCRMDITARQLQDLQGDFHRTGWEIVLDNVIGSAYPEMWSFEKTHKGGMLVIRHREP